jgi:hypothetical protein
MAKPAKTLIFALFLWFYRVGTTSAMLLVNDFQSEGATDEQRMETNE